MAAFRTSPPQRLLARAGLLGAVLAAAVAVLSLQVVTQLARPVAGAPSAATIFVDLNDPTPDGPGCGSPANPCNTIQAGISNAAAGDTVRVAEGVYYERLNISKDLTLQGANRATTRVDAEDLGRAVVVFGDSTVTIEQLTIQHGRSPEGGGLNINFSQVTLSDVDVAQNTAVTDGAGVYCGPGSTAVISYTRVFSNNVMGELGGGGGVYVASDAHVTVHRSEIHHNVAGRGGAIASVGTVSVTNSSLHLNTARASGAGIWTDGIALVSDSAVRDNNVEEANSDGGGITTSGLLTVERSTIQGNSSTRYGGGINSLVGSTTVRDSTISDNFGSIGGGIFNEPNALLTVDDSTLSGNDAEVGAGLRNHGTANLTNVTVSGNRATGNGGGLANFIGTLDLLNCTIPANEADVDHVNGGDAGGVFRTDGTVRLKNTLLAANADLSPTSQYDDCFGSFQSDGNNLVGDADGCTGFSGSVDDITGTSAVPIDPEVGSLADNGGQTLTHALLAGSPAIDTGSDVGCPSADQRGAHRPFDGDGSGGATCDIGSFELGPTVATQTPTSTSTATLTPSPTITPTATLTPSPTPTVSVTPEESPTPTATNTRLPTVGPTPTPTLGPSPTPTIAPSPSASPTEVPPTASDTPAVETATATSVPQTDTPTSTDEPVTPVPTDAPSAVPTASATMPIDTPSPEPSPEPAYLPMVAR
ncbi:MAG: choice-of-anchor Q domain-containing protein [Anaerolineae bacterium]